MITYFIYFVVAVILLIVIVIAGKAVNRGIEARQKNNNHITNYEQEDFVDNNETDIVKQISQLNKLHSDGILTDEEFKKAKERILK